MIPYRDFLVGLRRLGVPNGVPVLVHASLSAFGEIRGGTDTVIGALLSSFHGVMVPIFTYYTMVIPETGPNSNGIRYGSGRDTNKMAQFYSPDMPADRMMGRLAEAIRQHPEAQRSMHPILSFSGVGVEMLLEVQTLQDPFSPIQMLSAMGGWVLLLGVDHTVNTSLHYAEKVAGRKQFVRWALTPTGVMTCPGWPGCSDGFETLAPVVASITRKSTVGMGQIRALPASEMIATAVEWMRKDPMAMLCKRTGCERCGAVRAAVHGLEF